MFKCPFCQSTDCEALQDVPNYQVNQQYPSYSYNDNLQEYVCNNCGIVTKVDLNIYKVKDEEK